MHELYPLLFTQDQFRPYMWGGQRLRPFVTPEYDGQPIAELWAIADRPEENIISVIANGPLRHKNIHQLLVEYGDQLTGSAQLTKGKFPLLIKLIDPLDNLSSQVHPPKAVAQELGGDPKTEAWYILDGAARDAHLYAGFKPGVTKELFDKALRDGAAAEWFYKLNVAPGDVLYIPSGRLHTIGKGCFLLEVQENSNTTYRVFDWNRIDTKTGRPRELHIDQALRSIDFNDIEPSFEHFPVETIGSNQRRRLIDSPLFQMESWQSTGRQEHHVSSGFDVIFAEDRPLTLHWSGGSLEIEPLGFCLIPHMVKTYSLVPDAPAKYIRIFME